MRLSFFFSIIILSLFFALTGCKKEGSIFDPCKDKVCLNGGYCESGACKCPTYYSGANCEVDNRPACMKEHTGTISIANQSSSTVGILLDGSPKGTIPTGSSMQLIVSVGNSHRIDWQMKIPIVNLWETVDTDYTTVSECGDSPWVFHN